MTSPTSREMDVVTSEVNNFIRPSTNAENASKSEEEDQTVESLFTFTQPIWWTEENNRCVISNHLIPWWSKCLTPNNVFVVYFDQRLGAAPRTWIKNNQSTAKHRKIFEIYRQSLVKNQPAKILQVIIFTWTSSPPP